MLVCLDCGALFEESITHTERHGLDSPPYETTDCCPKCKSEAIREALSCDACQDYISYDVPFIKTSEGRIYCNNCYLEYDYDDIF